MPEKTFSVSFETSGFRRASRRMNKVGNEADRAGSNLKSAGKVGAAAIAAITAAATAAAGATTKMASDFEKSFSKIEGLVGLSEDQVSNLRKEVLALSDDVAKGPQELSNALFQITSAGLEGEKAMNALEASAKAAQAGLGDTKTVADAATSAMNAYSQGNLAASEATDVLVASVREGKVEPEELSQSLGKVIPNAASLGVEFEQVGAALAAMTRQGSNARRATTALNSLLTKIQKPTKEAKEALDTVGLSVDRLRKRVEEDGILAVMNLLEDEFKGNRQALTKLFPDVRAMRAALQLTGDNADQVRSIFDKLQNSTGATDEAFQEAKETFNFQFQQLRTSLQKLGIRIGTKLLPHIQALVSFLQEVVSAAGSSESAIGSFISTISNAISTITSLSDTTKGVIVVITGLTAAVSAGIAIWSAWPTILGAVTAGFSGVATAATTAWSAIFSPVGAVVAAVAAVAGSAALIWDNWNAVSGFFVDLFDTVLQTTKDFGRFLGDKFNNIWLNIKKIFVDGINGILSTVNSGLRLVGQEDQTFDLIDTKGLKEDIKESNTELKNFTKEAQKRLEDNKSELGQSTSKMMSGFKESVNSAFQETKEMFSDVGSALSLPSFGSEDDEEDKNGPSIETQDLEGESVKEMVKDAELAKEGMKKVNKEVRKGEKNTRKWSATGAHAFRAMKEGSKAVAQRGIMTLNRTLQNVISNANSIGDAFSGMADAAVQALKRMIVKLTTAAGLAIILSQTGIGSALGMGSDFSEVLSSLTGLAEGGIVTGPTTALIGEGSEDEAVMPLSKLDSMLSQSRERGVRNGPVVRQGGRAKVSQDSIEIPLDVLSDGVRQAKQSNKNNGHASIME